MSGESVLVLDLGGSKVTALAARLDERVGFQVRALVTEPCSDVKKGIVTDAEAVSQAISAVIRKLADRIEIDTEEVIVSIGGPSVEGTSVQGLKPIVPRGRLISYQDVLEVINHSRSVVMPEDREQIQALPRSFKVDTAKDVQKPIGMPAGKLEVATYVVTAPIAAVQAVNHAVTGAGFHIEQLVFSPLASGIGVLTQDEMEHGAVVVDIGHGTTGIGVFSKGSIAHGVSLPVGSRNISSDVSQLLKTTFAEADRLKLSSGCAKASLVPRDETVDVFQIEHSLSRPLQRTVLAEIIEARVKEIALMTKAEIKKSGLYEDLPGGLILTGGGARLLGVEKVFEEHLKHFKVRVAEPQLPPRISESTGTAVAVGLAGFALQCYDELSPPSGQTDWKDRIRSLFSLVRK